MWVRALRAVVGAWGRGFRSYAGLGGVWARAIGGDGGPRACLGAGPVGEGWGAGPRGPRGGRVSKNSPAGYPRGGIIFDFILIIFRIYYPRAINDFGNFTKSYARVP